jgi:hypothetical protein
MLILWGTYMKFVTKYNIPVVNSCWEKCDEKWAYMFNVYKNQQSRQAESRNLMGSKTLPTIWGTYMKPVTKYQIIFSATIYGRNLIFGHELHICTPYRGKRLWTHQISTSCLPTLLSLWPNIRFLSSIVALKNVTKNVHIQMYVKCA